MSIQDWKMENDLCRCCHSEGTFNNLAEPCMRLEKEEIYSEMLQQCFDLNITPIPGPLCGSTYTICPNCILRLRDAFQFKEQVKNCEIKFKELYDKEAIKLSSFIEVKLEQEVPDEEPEFITLKQDNAFDTDYDDDATNVCEIELKPKDESPEAARPKKAKVKAKPKAKAVKTRKVKPIEDKSKRGEDSGTGRHLIVIQDGEKLIYQCNVCDRVYSKRALFSQHYRHVHLKLRPKRHSCLVCGEKVSTHLRAIHLEQEHGIPRPVCNACGKKFSYPFQVILHQKRYHMNEKLYSCSKCDLKFTVPSRLARHEAKHSSNRPHKCELCDKAFKWKKNLKTHVMIHMNDRRHVCSVCSEAFVQQSSLRYHIMKRHPDVA